MGTKVNLETGERLRGSMSKDGAELDEGREFRRQITQLYRQQIAVKISFLITKEQNDKLDQLVFDLKQKGLKASKSVLVRQAIDLLFDAKYGFTEIIKK